MAWPSSYGLNGEGSISRGKDGLYMARYTLQTAIGPMRKTIYAKKDPAGGGGEADEGYGGS